MTTIVQHESAVSRRPAGTSSRGKRLLRRIGRGLLWIAIGLIALVAVGITYELIMSAGDAQRYPPPGQLVSVGEHRLHIHCIGEASPTVILEAGFGDLSLTWRLVQPEVAKFARVCAYDRAGLGWSEPGPEPRSPQQIASELHTLLDRAGIAGPYVLVAHSIGGKHARLFAARHPHEVAGMVLLDARHESVEPAGRTPEQNAAEREAHRSGLRLYEILGRLGIARAFGASLVASLDPSTQRFSDETRTLLALFASRTRTVETMVSESAGSTDGDEQLRAAGSLGDMPLVVLVSGEGAQNPNWLDAQHAQANLSTNSRLSIVQESGHNIQREQPEVVVDAVRDVVEAVRSGQPLNP